jgi:glycosyltransferase involved in cell wall biosynthesis
MRKLTIGCATHDDYDGVYFTIQSIRLYHSEVLNDIEFVIVDNNPDSEHGKALRNFIKWIKEPVQYLPFTKYKSTAIRNKVFELADTPYVLCIDSHVLLHPGSLKKLIDFYDKGLDFGNLLHGPLVYDDGENISTHFNLNWNSYMWGQWGTDDRGKDIDSPPFEIPAQGCGLFSCRKDSWLGYNKDFRGFGGEEGYIHKKYEKNGKTTLCLPFLRWTHRFDRPNGISYPNNLSERFKNYLIGFKELGIDTKELKEHFKSAISADDMRKIEDSLKIV